MSRDAGARDRRVAVVAPDPDLRSVISEILETSGYEVTPYEQTSDLLLARGRHPELIVLHPERSGASGRTSWNDLGQLLGHPTLGFVPVLVCSGDPQVIRDRAPRMSEDPRTDALEMPFDLDTFEAAVQHLLHAAPVRGWDDARDLVLVASADGQLIDASAAALLVLQVSQEELPQLQVADIVAAQREWTDAEWARYQGNGSWEGRVVLRTAGGQKLPAVATAEIVHLDGQAWHLSRLTLTEPIAVANA